jgi:crotonobetainyl-CoA:carnitine CoA-transferase CaiB-like acyl-CoA transferase
VSGYGEGHSYERMKAYDLLVQAESGIASITGHPAGPGRIGVSACDIACGMSAQAAVLEALIERGVTGRGRGLKVSLFDGMADWMAVPLLCFEGGRAPQRVGLAHPSICPYGAFTLADGDEVLVSIQNEREWAAFCAHLLQAPHLAREPGYDSNNARVANRAEVDGKVAQAFAALSRAEATERLREGGTAYGFVNDLAAFARHPALRRTPVETPGGPVSIPAPPAVWDGEDRTLGAVPAIGEHSAAIRAEFAP